MEKFIGRWAGAVLLGLLPVSALAASPLKVDRTNIAWAQQDSAGVVWGIAVYGSPGLYRWEQDAWQRVAGEGLPQGGAPVALGRGPDGAVFCLWNNPPEAHALTRHQGDSTRQFAQFTGPLADYPGLFVDPGGNLWITERGPHIYRVTPEGTAESAYTIPDDQFQAQNLPRNARPVYGPVVATADGRGRVWFWSESLFAHTNLGTIQGILIFDGEKFQHHPQLAGDPNARISIIEPADAQHMWVAVAGDQLYAVDIDTLDAVPVTPPEPRAFQTVQDIFRVDDDTYLIAGMPSQAVPDPTGGGRSSVLWRLRNGGWKKAVTGLDADLRSFPRSRRYSVSTPDGLWLGTFGNGPWFIPARGGEAKLIDWHYGYPLNRSDRLFKLSDGRLLMIAPDQGSAAVKPAELWAAYQSSPEVETINPYRELAQDARGNVLGILAAGDNALSDWDGQKWIKYPLPYVIKPEQLWVTSPDSLGRIWLLSRSLETPVAIFDAQRGSFETFPTYAEALQAQLPRQKDFHLDTKLFFVPSFTTDGRICFRDSQTRVRYFDGGRWRNWSTNEIAASNMVVFEGPPFFDRAGNLAVQLQGKTWEFTEQKGWQAIAREPGLGTDQELRRPRPVTMPAGCAVEHPDSIVQDRVGTYWLTWQGQLYRAIEGLCSPQFAPDENQPFVDSRKLRDAIIDAKGNAFLASEFAPNQMEYVVLKARPPLPRTTLRASVDSAGTVTLRFSTSTKGASWFTWRRDGGPWTAPTKSAETTIDGLPRGKHRIEAAAIDERLQIDPTPAETDVDIHVDTEAQIKALIQKLADPDYAVREKAVAALVLQSDLALPLLQSAREKAAPDQRWWIDAAVQQIEENLSKHKTP